MVVRAALERAVAHGHITREVAETIMQAEAVAAAHDAERAAHLAKTPTSSAPPAFDLAGHRPRHAATPAVEAIGYLGSILSLVGVGFLVGRAWKEIHQYGRVGLLGGLAAVLLVVGILLRHEDEAVLWRLRNFVLLLSTGALAGCAAVVVVDTFDWRGEPVSVSIGLVAALYSAVLWAGRDRPAQLATTVVGSLVAVSAAIGWVTNAGGVGLVVLVLGVAWASLAWMDVLPSGWIALTLGLMASLVGPAITNPAFHHVAPGFGAVLPAAPVVALALVLLAVGAHTHEFIFTGFGVVGLLAYITYAVADWFGNSLKAPGVLVVSGVALLVATLVLVRRRQGMTGGHPTPAT